MRTIFMGTPEFALPCLSAILEAGHDVVAVYCQPPRPAGRGQKLKRSPVHQFADDIGLLVRIPQSLKTDDEQAAFADLRADIAVVVAYGLILPKPVLSAPKHGCVNVHASLLPRWRGASPIHRAILAGDKESGVTIMQMDEGLDTGPMLARDRLPITPDMTAETLHDQLAAMGADLLARTMAELEAGKIVAEPQPETGVVYAEKLSRDEGQIDWTEPAETIARRARALNPWPGLWFEHDDCRIKLLKADAVRQSNSNAKPGTVVAHPLTVACGDGALRLIEVQRAGKSAMSAEEMVRGFDMPVGAQLGH